MIKQITVVFSILFFAVLETGCASIVNGQNQPISVKTDPTIGASCALENNKGRWYIPTTPGSVTVHRSFDSLRITCEKGHLKSEKNVSSTTKPMVFGNVLFGGAIGVGVDMADGAAYDYPAEIQVDMKKG